MAIPTVYSTVKPQDFTLKPFRGHKTFELSSATLTSTSSGYNLVDAVHTSLKTPIGSSKANNDPTNSFDGSYQHIIWQSYNHLYYKDPYNSFATFEHANRRYTYKFLNYSASILSIPYKDYGEMIKPRSVSITNTTNGFTLQDDGNGNLYDPSIDSSSFANAYNVVGYWGFNDEFKRGKYKSSTVEKGTLKYQSRVFEPDDRSGFKNITFDVGVDNSGMCAEFSGESYIITRDRPEFNPTVDDPMTISFWIKAPVSQSNETTLYNSIISKRGVIEEQVYGKNQKYNNNDLLITTNHISSSITDKLTDVYPYDFEFINSTGGGDAGKIRFRCSDGINTYQMLSPVLSSTKHTHVALVLNGTSAELYVNGRSESSMTIPENIYNKHSLMFGSLNRGGDQGLSGSLDEIRIYDAVLAKAGGVASLSNSGSMAMYQTAVVGNVFYRQGNIIVSPLQPLYNEVFNGTWSAEYQGTHTIYQYEVLCRIKKGSFNMTYNPTARKSHKSDLLINDMTGSVLYPYATTIGLYSSEGDLVAVAKMGQPIQMRDDVDINILIRFDS